VVLARDADDTDVTEAFAAALLTSGAVTLPGAQVGHAQALSAGVNAHAAVATGCSVQSCLRQWATVAVGSASKQSLTLLFSVELRVLTRLTLHMWSADGRQHGPGARLDAEELGGFQ